MKKRVVSLIIALSLISAPAYVFSAEGGEFDRNGESVAIFWDVVAVRPVSYIAMAAGAIIYLPAALFTMIGGNEIEPIQDALLKGPYEYAVKRPLGQFD
jgi:hypothetical protein